MNYPNHGADHYLSDDEIKVRENKRLAKLRAKSKKHKEHMEKRGGKADFIKNAKPITIDNVIYPSIREAAHKLKISRHMVLKKGKAELTT